jgi:hypothetical protein
MIIILVPHRNPPSVLDKTPKEIVMMVRDTSATGSYIATWPPGETERAFEGAWVALTKDMKSAQHFETLEEAMKHYETVPPELTVHQHSRVVDGLQRLAEAAGKQTAFHTRFRRR